MADSGMEPQLRKLHLAAEAGNLAALESALPLPPSVLNQADAKVGVVWCGVVC